MGFGSCSFRTGPKPKRGGANVRQVIRSARPKGNRKGGMSTGLGAEQVIWLWNIKKKRGDRKECQTWRLVKLEGGSRIQESGTT